MDRTSPKPARGTTTASSATPDQPDHPDQPDQPDQPGLSTHHHCTTPRTNRERARSKILVLLRRARKNQHLVRFTLIYTGTSRQVLGAEEGAGALCGGDCGPGRVVEAVHQECAREGAERGADRAP